MPRPDKIQLKDKYGRVLVEMDTPESIVATAATVGLTRAVFIKHEAKQYTGYVQKSVLDELNVSTVQIPANFAGLETIDTPTRLMDQYFEIYDVDEQDEYVEISARHIFYRNLKNYTLWKATEETEYTAAAVIRNVMTNAMFDSEFEAASDCTDTKPGKDLDYERKNLVECFLDPENGICAKFGLSLIRDNGFFYCLKEVGYDRGYLIQSGKNLLGVDRHENTDAVATRIAAYGKDAKGGIVWLDHNGLKYIDSQYINPKNPKCEIYETDLQIGKDGVTADNIQAKLLEAAQKRFSEDEVDKPEVTMTVEFISLGDTEEYAQYRDLDKVYLYDILTIRDTKRGYNYSAQVIGVEHDILTGRLNSVTIGSLKQASASRKIATWQVPEINGANIRLLSLQAGVFGPGAINGDDIANGAINTVHFASATIDDLNADAITAITAEIETIIAGHITAESIDTNSINAITAKLGIASIAKTEIESADINFAHIKDLSAGSAYFEEAIFEEAVGGFLYVPRLMVGYAQMVGATVADLVIKATNGKYYHLDVDTDAGTVSATEVFPNPEEIASGHTSLGQTIIDSDILAENLSTASIYATHALMGEITANTIDVDRLFAREATIAELNAMDIRGNVYIRSVIGDWESGSTITQTIKSLTSEVRRSTRTFIQFEDPALTEDVRYGDSWVKSFGNQSWNDVSEYTWDDLADTTWAQLCGSQTFFWDGSKWIQAADETFEITMRTAFNQTEEMLQLEAEKIANINGEIEHLYAEIEVTTEEILEEVSRKIGEEAYVIRSGISIKAEGIKVSGSQYVIIESGGYFKVQTGNFGIDTDSSTYVVWSGASTAASSPFWLKKDGEIYSISGTVGGFTLAQNSLSSGASTTYVNINSNSNNVYAMWAGNESASSAPYRLKRDGTVYLTKLVAVDENGSESEVNLRTVGLWKLNYATVKSISVSGNTLTIATTAGTTTFSKAVTAHLVGSWNGNTYSVIADNDPEVLGVSTTLAGERGTGTTSGTWNVTAFDSNHKAYARVSATGVPGNLFGFNIDATSEYNQGWNDALTDCGISGGGTVYTGSIRQVYDPDLDVWFNALSPYYAHQVSAKQ